MRAVAYGVMWVSVPVVLMLGRYGASTATHRRAVLNRCRAATPSTGTPQLDPDRDDPTPTPTPTTRRRSATQQRRRLEQLASDLEEVAVAVSGGVTLRRAILAEATTAHPDAIVQSIDAALGAEFDNSGPLGDSFGDTSQRSSRAETKADAAVVVERTVVVAMRALISSGADPGPPVERLVSSIRDRLELDGETRAAGAPAMASAVALSALPVLGVCAIGAVEPATVRWLTHSPAGLLVMCGSIVANAVGWWWMRRIVAGVTR